MTFVREQILKLNKFEKVFGILLQMFGDELNFPFWRCGDRELYPVHCGKLSINLVQNIPVFFSFI